MIKDLRYLLEHITPDKNVVGTGRRRMDDIWNNRETDCIPVLYTDRKIEEREKFPKYNFREQFYDKEKMLAEQLWGIIPNLETNADTQFSIRVNFGTGFVPTIFGLEEDVYEDRMPFMRNHLTKKQILDFEFPKDIKKAGLVPLALEYSRYFIETLKDKVYVFVADTQGPFDIAHLVYGDNIFTDVYDDPDFVHRLMEMCTRAYIEVTKAIKDVTGEPYNTGYHSTIYMGNGGVRLCEDTSTLLSPKTISEFVVPYTSRVLEAFGGGWIHFCGNNRSLFEQLIECKNVRGINFGNPENFNQEAVMDKILGLGKFYYGSWQNTAGSVREYFKTTLKYLKGKKKGLIFTPAVSEEDKAKEKIDDVVKLWRDIS